MALEKILPEPLDSAEKANQQWKWVLLERFSPARS
jgi:hypothetical protein